ncbi:putative sugar O-methyltransferase [Rugamonas sp. CCM 8940]|uniref:putative sugar O-methyltransferase n=1 Tax=Rugamonas sp. CCM 8940 TaxID=2765359 RepID=UPI0018F4F1BB|nr:putative sugar O-methyltransferase [Rugamonas sp. CCM 8940]MBJ7309768.1 putative sugar O-methyltransferase [Rugamonas sp. CCM 8940]
MLLIVDNGFIDRKMEVDGKIIDRVIASYNKAKAVQKDAAEEYQVSHMWLPIYQGYMGKVMEVMASGDAAELARIYGNFFRETCSIGIHGMPVDMESTYFSGNVSEDAKGKYIADIMHRMQIWLDSIGKTHSLDALQTPQVGNPYGFEIDGKFFRAGVDYQHYYATIISRLIRGEGHTAVLELGGGFGGLGHFLMRDNSNFTYIDVDLPENMALSAFYLLSCFPDKKIALYGEIDLATADLSRYDGVVLPNFALAELKDDSVDLAFNSYSLAEMSLNNVANYVQQFSRLASKFIYHVNHTRIPPVRADDFAFDFDKFELISRAPALWNLARNKDMDEYEYLYKSKRLSFR